MPGKTVAIVQAYVVPASGVGWVDCTWEGKVVPIIREERRVLADWRDQDHPRVVRQIIPVADDWFAYCAPLAERELALIALAAEEAKGQRGVTGPSPLGGHVHGPVSQEKQLSQEFKRQMEALLASDELAGSASPGAGDQAVEDMLSTLAGSAVFGASESTSDGLSNLGDDLAETEVGR